MASLSIRLLGPFDVRLEGESVRDFESDKVRALLAYLVTESDRPHRREMLAGLLWPEFPDQSARTNLRRALASLRRTLNDHQASPPFFLISRQTIQFNLSSDAWCDVTRFGELLATDLLPGDPVDSLEEGVALYRGSFLEGFPAGDSVAFEEWALVLQERFLRKTLAALQRLAEHCEARGEFACALNHLWRQVELEPWREEAHRKLMRLLALSGQRGVALAQYESCRRALAQELGVKPASETTRLYEIIRDGEVSGSPKGDEGWPHTVAAGQRAPTEDANRRPLRRWEVQKSALLAASLLLGVMATILVLFLSGVIDVDGNSGATGSGPPPETWEVEAGGIVYDCPTASFPQICVTDSRSGREIQVTEGLTFDHISLPSWSPDGQQIVFQAGPHTAPGHQRADSIYRINADGSGLTQLMVGEAADANPVWSPNGSWIAFQRDRGLVLVEPDGTGMHMLLGSDDLFVDLGMVWSPNSRRIAFLNRIGPPPFHPLEIWIVNADGSDLRLIHAFEEPPHCELVGWAPSDEQVACAREFEQETVYLLISVDGSGSAEPLDHIPQSWSPNFWPQWGGSK